LAYVDVCQLTHSGYEWKVHFCEQSKFEDALFSVGAQHEVLAVQLWQEVLESKSLTAARKSSEPVPEKHVVRNEREVCAQS